ncbi:melatonin receptor type 1B-like [Saccostrea echinata]|uniref:melatonin receptor type 1B-like n=1 Tax=Saccostrea echinata TaxID=191078 RepID=UPI002A839C9D|nr:melatonin receptor type 1B-like [Saccostrea echinata]
MADPTFLWATLSVLYPVTLLIGLYGNISGLVVLFRQRKKTGSLVLLQSICVANLLSVVLVSWLTLRLNLKLYGFESVITENSQWQMKFYAFIGNIPISWIAFTTASIAVERACVMTMPMKFHNSWTTRKMYVAVCLIYFLGMVVPIPKFFDLDKKSVTLIDTLITRIIPIAVVIIGFSITMTAFSLHSKDKLVRQLSDSTPSKFLKRKVTQRNRLTKTLVILMVAFLFCVVPKTAFTLIVVFGEFKVRSFLFIPETEMDITMVMIMYLEVLHCCINAFMYILSYRNFKREFVNVMCCNCERPTRKYDSRMSERHTLSELSSVDSMVSFCKEKSSSDIVRKETA